MATFVFLDTCNWVYLSNGFNIFSNKHDDLHFKIFDIIEKRVEDGSLVFLVNDIILEEFERNKARTEAKINEIEKKSNGYINSLKPIKDFAPDEEPALEQLKLKISDRAKQKIAVQRAHISKVEAFIKTTTKKIPISDANKIEATDLALAKKAPFIGDKKNSTADALLLLSSIDYIQKNEGLSFKLLDGDDDDTDDLKFYSESYFVSSNSGDFSDPVDKEKIHPDLEPILKRSKTKFYHNLNPLITSLEDKFLTREEEASIESADNWISCEICEDNFSKIEFSKYFYLFDPNRIISDPMQLPLFPKENIVETKADVDPIVEVRTASCDHCGADFIECPSCLELVYMPEYNVKTSCNGCNYKFILHAEIDRKGMIYVGEYEIISDYICVKCGEEVSGVNNDGLCDECAEYEKLVEQN